MKSQIEYFDGLDNRKTVMRLFSCIGVGEQADKLRKRCIQRLIKLADNCFAEKMVEVTPLNAVEAYQMFLQICWALQVPIEKAAIELERFASRRSGVIAG